MTNDADVRARVLRILRDVTGNNAVLDHPELPLFDSGVLDSLGLVQLILAFDAEFKLTISPAELDREQWATPRDLADDVERRLATVPTERV